MKQAYLYCRSLEGSRIGVSPVPVELEKGQVIKRLKEATRPTHPFPCLAQEDNYSLPTPAEGWGFTLWKGEPVRLQTWGYWVQLMMAVSLSNENGDCVKANIL